MIPKPQLTTDSFDLSWIQRQTPCWVYFPLEQQSPIYIRGIVKGIVPLSFNKGNSKVMGILENGSQFQTKANCLQKSRQTNHLQRDLINLEIINAAEVLNQLNRKLNDKRIHTYLWNSLIIVNPFKLIPSLYEEKTKNFYYENVFEKKGTILDFQPHVYSYICDIVNKLSQSEKMQMLCISGESGSGKTQTNKQCLKIISYICERSARIGDTEEKSIEQKILNCDGILQSFGNAKTSKNDNSSRFGKLVTESIRNDKMQIVKCQIKVFFLQKSRIISQSQNERNFHVFYQLLKFCPQSLRQELKLKHRNGSNMRVSDFAYLKKSQYSQMTTIQDEEMWKDLLNSFQFLQFSQSTIQEIWKILVAVLYLGNLQFDDDNLNDHDPCDIENQELVKVISQLILVPEKQLLQILLFHKKIFNKEVLFVPLSKNECIDNSRTFSKALYENLFLWIVGEINIKVNEHQKPSKNVKQLKMLDIYGFEVFEKNSFEQLCVNYTNERIHQVYLDQVFKHQKNTLRKEGLQSAIPTLNFTDNTKILQILDSSTNSVYNLLDASCTLQVRDEDYLANVKKHSEGHEHFPPSNNVITKKAFIIKHTPCQIQYSVEGFRSKNKDFLKQDIAEKLSKSKSKIISAKFTQHFERIKSETNRKFLGFKIRKQVSSLINEISFNSDIHFIRCIKPNEEKKAFTFVERVCYNQIKYLGILDTVQMRKNCYHVRIHYNKFYAKYGILDGNVDKMLKVDKNQFTNEQCKEFTKQFFQKNFKNEKIQYLFGKERLFLKMEAQNYLDVVYKKRMLKVTASSTVIKALCRYQRERNERMNYKVRICNVQNAVRNYMRIAKSLRFKKAVLVIEREWIKRYDEYFRRKKRPALMVIQKNMKTRIAKIVKQKKKESLDVARKRLSSMVKAHKVADRYQDYCMIRTDLLTKVYDQIWMKMKKSYNKNLQKYMKSFKTKVTHKEQITTANRKTNKRLNEKYTKSIEKYFHTLKAANSTQQVIKIVKRLQSIYRMNKIRKNYLGMREKVIKIQKNWRYYYKSKFDSMKYTSQYFQDKTEDNWKGLLHKNWQKNILVNHQGVEKTLSDFERIKKDKITLFYYLLDVQILVNTPAILNWEEKYINLFEDGLFKFNPIQYVDVSENQTVISTTNKVYSWGSFTIDDLPGVQEHQIPNGKISKVSVSNENINITLPNKEEFIIGGGEKGNNNRDWSTLRDNFIILNGNILTVANTSFTKLNIAEKVSQLSCGMDHFICKTILKKVYTWGKNEMGQLGHGNYHQCVNNTPRIVQYFIKKKISIQQVGATAYGSVVLDTNGRIFWFGSNGTIKNCPYPEECFLSDKSNFLGNSQRYTTLRLIPKWSKSLSIIGITIACHDNILKNQISLRKKVFENLVQKWNEDIHTVNPPYNQNISNYFYEKHMPLPTYTESTKIKTSMQKSAKEKLLMEIGMIEEAEKELLQTRRNKR